MRLYSVSSAVAEYRKQSVSKFTLATEGLKIGILSPTFGGDLVKMQVRFMAI
jgi:hypothetical protein